MRRIAIIAAIGIAVSSPWWVDAARVVVRKTLLQTTADPDALGLVATASMDPIDITLHTLRPERIEANGLMGAKTERTGRTIEQKLTFRAPAAYFSLIYLKEGPAGAQSVGFSVWADKFEPSQPDNLRALSRQKPLQPPDRDDPILAELSARQAGEDVLQFDVSNYYEADKQDHQRGFDYLARTESSLPCERKIDPVLAMTTISVPDGKRAFESCLGGTSDNARTYLKFNSDGSAKFAAVCAGSGPRDEPFRGRCRLHGHFGNWPLFAWVPAQKPEKWNSYFDRIQKFLANITAQKQSALRG